jgi:hypothetical protein
VRVGLDGVEEGIDGGKAAELRKGLRNGGSIVDVERRRLPRQINQLLGPPLRAPPPPLDPGRRFRLHANNKSILKSIFFRSAIIFALNEISFLVSKECYECRCPAVAPGKDGASRTDASPAI